MDYIDIPQAASYLSVTVQCVYKQIRLYKIKALKLQGKIMTTTQWLDEYEKSKGKPENFVFAGVPVNRPEKGEYSVPYVAEVLGVNRMFVLNRIARGKIAVKRKGIYYIIPEDEFFKLKAYVEQLRDDHVENLKQKTS